MRNALDLHYQLEQSRVTFTLKAALEAATALGQQNLDFTQPILRIAARIPSPQYKATFLSSAAKVLADGGRPDAGLTLLLAALDTAKLAGRDSVLEVLADGATTIAAVDNGQLLCTIYGELEAIDEWFVGESMSSATLTTNDVR